MKWWICGEREYPSNTESIIADDMSLKQADHMSDLLREIPGVDVGGTHSVNQRITIRGLSLKLI